MGGNSTRGKRERPKSPEVREQELINLAVDLAEKQLREGTAKSQLIVHYLKLASVREKLENEKLRRENRLLEARVKAIDSYSELHDLYEEAMKAMREYSGDSNENI